MYHAPQVRGSRALTHHQRRTPGYAPESHHRITTTARRSFVRPYPPHQPHSLNANEKMVNNCRRSGLMRSGTDMCQIIQFIWDLASGEAYSNHVASIKASHQIGGRHWATPVRRAMSRRHPGMSRWCWDQAGFYQRDTKCSQLYRNQCDEASEGWSAADLVSGWDR